MHRAASEDVDAICDLLRRARPAEPIPDRDAIARLVDNGWLLLLEASNAELLGAVHVRLERGVGHVSLLTIEPDHRTEELAVRLLGVASALCDAFGCTPHEELGDIVAA
ncbi:MAG TPA: hypothetical protein VM261_16655 [Kofleriaceae bacterium]|nr:hypothetical protein [Kofleriaceae bacterium]